MIAVAVGMFFAVFALFTYLDPQTRRRVVGYGMWVDVCVWALFIGVFGGTGIERLSAVFASMGVTAFIHAYRYTRGYERLTARGWRRYRGIWS